MKQLYLSLKKAGLIFKGHTALGQEDVISFFLKPMRMEQHIQWM